MLLCHHFVLGRSPDVLSQVLALLCQYQHSNPEESLMSKTGRKRRSRRKNKANHGKRPNA